MKLRILLVPILGLVVMVLSGCSGGPSESEIVTALKSQDPDQSPEEKAMLATLSVKKLGCKADDVSGYVCDIETKTEKASPFDGKNTHIVSVRMIKGSAGWTLQPLRNR